MSFYPLNHFSQLLEKVYAALWSSEGMDGALKALKKYFNCCSATLVCMQKEPRQIVYGWSVGIPESYGRPYIENNWVAKDVAIDYFAAESPKQASFVASSQMLKDTPLLDVVDEEFKPWLEEEAIVDTCGYILTQSNTELQLISFQRNQSAGQFSEQELQQMNLIIPHVKQCLGLFNSFHQQQTKSDTLQAALNSLQLPTLVLNNLLQVVHANPSAEQFLMEHQALVKLQNKQLVIQDEDKHHEYIFHACKLVSYRVNSAEENNHLTLSLPCDQGELQFNISPIFSLADPAESGKAKQGLLVQCCLIEKTAELSVTTIRQHLNITKAEAQICLLLAQGLNVTDISVKRGVSVHTVREQLRSVYKKTPYSRQGELITALLSLSV